MTHVICFSASLDRIIQLDSVAYSFIGDDGKIEAIPFTSLKVTSPSPAPISKTWICFVRKNNEVV